MPKVDENRQKANYASAYVAVRLCPECLVRPVAADTDVGVDLYCETVEAGQPYLHFWLQVKSGAAQITEKPDKTAATCPFDRDHLAYWDRQPVPVFAALVPLQWPLTLDPNVYVVDVTTHLLRNGIPKKDSRTLSSTYVWRPGDARTIVGFLRQVVPSATAAQRCRQGVITSIPTLQPEYVQKYPGVPVQLYEEAILRQLRTTAAFSIIQAWSSGAPEGLSPRGRRTLAAVVAQFEGDPHYENYMARALSHHADEEYDEAARLYQEALQCIRRDKRVRDMPTWGAKVRFIEKLMAMAQDGEQL